MREKSMSSPSVQLYTIREAISGDPQGAVARIDEIGFTDVESYAFVERAEEYERGFAANGLISQSGHPPVIDADVLAESFMWLAENGK
jgi:hypothetical protein